MCETEEGVTLPRVLVCKAECEGDGWLGVHSEVCLLQKLAVKGPTVLPP